MICSRCRRRLFGRGYNSVSTARCVRVLCDDCVASLDDWLIGRLPSWEDWMMDVFAESA